MSIYTVVKNGNSGAIFGPIPKVLTQGLYICYNDLNTKGSLRLVSREGLLITSVETARTPRIFVSKGTQVQVGEW